MKISTTKLKKTSLSTQTNLQKTYTPSHEIHQATFVAKEASKDQDKQALIEQIDEDMEEDAPIE